jgi:plastocyanin
MGRQGSPVLALLLLAAAAFAAPAHAATFDVRMGYGAFYPAAVTIETGDTVRWTSSVHPAPPPPYRTPPGYYNRTIVSDTSTFASPVLPEGGSFSFTFTTPGTFGYTYIGLGSSTARGTVQVNAATVTLAPTSAIVPFGTETHLTGVVSSKRAGERVSLFERGFEQPSWTQSVSVTTGVGGTFDLVARPVIATTYAVDYRGVRSGEVTVEVRPTVTFRPGRTGFFVAGVSAGRSYAGRSVTLQRRTEAGHWAGVAQYVLGPRAQVSFRIPRRRGVVRYRVYAPVSPGFAESWSGTQTVRRR